MVCRGATAGAIAACAAACALALCSAGGAAGGGPAAEPAPSAWQVTASPFRLTFLAAGKPLLAEAETSGGPGGRLSYRLADGSFHTLTTLTGSHGVPGGTAYLVATDEPGRSATVTVRRTATGIAVAMHLDPSAGVTETFEAFAPTPGEHFLGGGERPGPLDLRGAALAIKTSYACKNTMPAPFLVSSAGWGVSLESPAIAALALPGADPAAACAGGTEPRCPLAKGLDVVQLCSKASSLGYRVYGGTPEQIVSAYTRVIGRPLQPEPSQFELIKWRDIVSGPSELLADVDELRRLHVPIGWILLDNPWETGDCYGSMTFDASKFPDPAAMIRELHARGVRLMLWISPLVRRQWCPPPPQYAPSALIGTGHAATLDLTDAATAKTFEAGLERLLALGVDGFKADRGDEIDLESAKLAAGPGTIVQNLYPLLYARDVAAAIRAAGLPRSFPTLFRAGSPGSSATVSGFWAGDQLGTFAGLQAAIHDGLSAGVAGYPIWGSDTGGYANAPPEPVLTPEVFVRWAQFSAVSPVFEVGGVGKSATFWDFGPRTVSLFRAAAVLHYELFPYLWQLASAAHATGIPILRPLALEYPGEADAWRYDLEALVGSDLLAAPVTEAAGPDGVAHPSVYLPAGRWVDLASGRELTGGSPFVRPTPLAELPLYLRAGSAIPFAARTPQLWPEAWPTDALRLAGRGGWLYAPAQGRTTATGFGTLTATVSGGTATLTLRGAPRQTQILLAGRRAPLAVEIDGRAVARSASLAALRRAPQGWALARAPFRGTVLKLAPAHGAARVVLRLP